MKGTAQANYFIHKMLKMGIRKYLCLRSKAFELVYPLIVDCVWNKWIIGECPKPCGTGARNITRTQKVEATNGGRACTGPSFLTEKCNVEDCPGNNDRMFSY